jgi:hypothetical protein
MQPEVDDACRSPGSASARSHGPTSVDIAVLPATSRDTARDVPAIIAYASTVSGDAHGCCHQWPAMLARRMRTAGRDRVTEADVAGGAVPLRSRTVSARCSSCRFRPAPAPSSRSASTRTGCSTRSGRGVTVLFGTATSYRLLLKIPDLERRGNHRSLRLCVSAASRSRRRWRVSGASAPASSSSTVSAPRRCSTSYV